MTGARSESDARDQGSFTVELVVLTPVILVFVLLAVACGRFEMAREQVVGAARAGAEAAAVVPVASDAAPAATAAAIPVVGGPGPACQSPVVAADTTDFVPGGSVQVSVTCQVDLSDVLVPGLPGHTQITATVRAPIDPYRSTQ